jgi:Mg2+-importing ATPase
MRLLITKGAPESVIERCSRFESAGQILPLTEGQLDECHATFHELSNQGYRVLAVAYRDIESRNAYSADDETALILVGYLAFVDPPRPDIASTIAALQN